MKKWGVVLVALGSLAVTAWALAASAWGGSTPAAAPATEASTRSAAWQYHQGHARHWRNCLLQR
jgi:hypothetical protein